MADGLVNCPYCGEGAVLAATKEIYPLAQRNYGWFWLCRTCRAWVGCHPKTIRPLGRLANAELRAAKQAAHAAFDPFWKRMVYRGKMKKSYARKRAYAWLAGELNIPSRECHIGMFDIDLCQRTVAICRERADEERLNMALSREG